MEKTPVEWLMDQLETYGDPGYCKIEWETLDELIKQVKEMEKDREVRIKELETFLQEYILDDVYYYHSPIWYRATELLNQTID